jgi:hypothetical protein
VKGDNAGQLVGKGTVDGTLENEVIEGQFHAAADNSHVEIKISRK